jgi:hypothetical protein
VEFEKDGRVGQFSIQHACLVHPNPRRPLKSLSFMNDTWDDVVITDPPTARRDTPFFDWVDSIFDER